jgi:WD40 repeat protein
LRVFNRIYQAVFDRDWVAAELAKLRPAFYGAAIAAWLQSGDESVLLRGEPLRDGLEWAQGKQLSDEDSRFLRESQEAENRAEKEANQILTVATTKAKKRLVWSTAWAIVSAAGAIVALVVAGNAVNETGKVKEEAQKAQGEAQKAQGETQKAQGETQKAQRQYQQAQQQVVQATQQLEDVNQEKETAIQAKVEAEVRLIQARQQLLIATNVVQQVRNQITSAKNAANDAKEARKIAIEQRDVVQQGIELEREGISLLRLPNDEYFNRQTKLVAALELARETQSLLGKVKIHKALSDYPTKIPILNLRLIVNNIANQDKSRRFIASEANGKSLITLYDLSGRQIAELQGNKPKLNPNGRQIITENNDKSHLYDLMGKELTQLNGKNARFSNDGKKVITSAGTIRLSGMKKISGSQLYNFSNVSSDWLNLTLPFIILGDNARFSSDSNTIVSRDYLGIWVSNLSGRISSELSVDIPAPRICFGRGYEDKDINSISISPDAPETYLCELDLVDQGLADFTDNPYPTFISDSGNSIVYGTVGKIFLHDMTVKKNVEFQGDYGRFSPDRTEVLTVDNEKNTFRRYRLTGEKLVEFSEVFKIAFPSYSPDGKTIIASTYFNGDADLSRLYDLIGRQIRDFPGIVPMFSPDGQSILTTFQGEDITRLYDLEGNLLAEYLGSTFPRDRNFLGLSLGFNNDGTQIRTFTNDGTLHVWDIDANLTTDGGLTDLINRGCAKLKNFRHREDVRKVCPEGS